MVYDIEEIINLSKIKNMLDNLYYATNLPYRFVDSEGRILISEGFSDVHKNIHGNNITPIKVFIDSYIYTYSSPSNDDNNLKDIYTNKLMNIEVPIIVEGNKIATLFIGHFFVKKIDVEYFKTQAKALTIDENEYIKAVSEIPICDIKKIEKFTLFLLEIGNIIAEMAVNQIKLKELGNKLVKQKKTAIKCQKARTDFLAGISHELRTPINVIYSALQVCRCALNSEDTDYNIKEAKLNKYFDIIKQNSYRMIKLINNLIDITKIDGEYLKIESTDCDITAIIKEITLSVQDFTSSRELSLYFETNVESKIISCDENKIERIMLNLLSNAIKYTDKGGNIYVKFIDKGDLVEISVKDTGIGIPLERQKDIFERFTQGEKSSSGIQQSSGIGLSLVKALVEMHEGTIKLNSECGKGSEFIIELPSKLTKSNSKKLKKYNLNSSNKVENVNIELSDIYM